MAQSATIAVPMGRYSGQNFRSAGFVKAVTKIAHPNSTAAAINSFDFID